MSEIQGTHVDRGWFDKVVKRGGGHLHKASLAPSDEWTTQLQESDMMEQQVISSLTFNALAPPSLKHRFDILCSKRPNTVVNKTVDFCCNRQTNL